MYNIINTLTKEDLLAKEENLYNYIKKLKNIYEELKNDIIYETVVYKTQKHINNLYSNTNIKKVLLPQTYNKYCMLFEILVNTNRFAEEFLNCCKENNYTNIVNNLYGDLYNISKMKRDMLSIKSNFKDFEEYNINRIERISRTLFINAVIELEEVSNCHIPMSAYGGINLYPHSNFSNKIKEEYNKKYAFFNPKEMKCYINYDTLRNYSNRYIMNIWQHELIHFIGCDLFKKPKYYADNSKVFSSLVVFFNSKLNNDNHNCIKQNYNYSDTLKNKHTELYRAATDKRKTFNSFVKYLRSNYINKPFKDMEL